MKRLVLPVLLGLIAAPALAETSKTVRDWSASCDDSKNCMASAPSEGGTAMGGQGYRLEVARDADGDAGWTVKFVANKVPQPAEGIYLTLKADGVELSSTEVLALGDSMSFGFSDGTELPKIFAGLKKAKRLEISYLSDDGDVTEGFSLSGLAAVLLWIDEQQGRVGNSSQTVAYPMAGPQRDLSGQEAEDFKAEILKVSPASACQWLDENSMPGLYRPESYDLGEGKTLYIVPCTMGAYQGASVVFLRDDQGLRPLSFPDYSESYGWGGTFEIGYQGFSTKGKMLYTYVKFRGLGDCGSTATYQWRDFGFKLMEYRYLGTCNDNPENDEIPEFPVIYKATEGE
jgi:hypothetical protein